jgi:hypothetical protein
MYIAPMCPVYVSKQDFVSTFNTMEQSFLTSESTSLQYFVHLASLSRPLLPYKPKLAHMNGPCVGILASQVLDDTQGNLPTHK